MIVRMEVIMLTRVIMAYMPNTSAEGAPSGAHKDSFSKQQHITIAR